MFFIDLIVNSVKDDMKRKSDNAARQNGINTFNQEIAVTSKAIEKAEQKVINF